MRSTAAVLSLLLAVSPAFAGAGQTPLVPHLSASPLTFKLARLHTQQGCVICNCSCNSMGVCTPCTGTCSFSAGFSYTCTGTTDNTCTVVSGGCSVSGSISGVSCSGNVSIQGGGSISCTFNGCSFTVSFSDFAGNLSSSSGCGGFSSGPYASLLASPLTGTSAGANGFGTFNILAPEQGQPEFSQHYSTEFESWWLQMQNAVLGGVQNSNGFLPSLTGDAVAPASQDFQNEYLAESDVVIGGGPVPLLGSNYRTEWDMETWKMNHDLADLAANPPLTDWTLSPPDADATPMVQWELDADGNPHVLNMSGNLPTGADDLKDFDEANAQAVESIQYAKIPGELAVGMAGGELVGPAIGAAYFGDAEAGVAAAHIVDVYHAIGEPVVEYLSPQTPPLPDPLATPTLSGPPTSLPVSSMQGLASESGPPVNQLNDDIAADRAGLAPGQPPDASMFSGQSGGWRNASNQPPETQAPSEGLGKAASNFIDLFGQKKSLDDALGQF